MNTEKRFINCEHCGTEGRIYVGRPNDPNPRDDGPCPVCNGECAVEIEVEPVTMDDLERCQDCGAKINPMMFPCFEKTCPHLGEVIKNDNPDGEIGMAWWNNLSRSERKQWMEAASNTGRAADAWAVYKAQRLSTQTSHLRSGDRHG